MLLVNKKDNNDDEEDDNGSPVKRKRFDKDDGWCFISIDLTKEISSFFSLELTDSNEVIGRWVENTLQMKVTKTTDAYMNIDQWLRIP